MLHNSDLLPSQQTILRTRCRHCGSKLKIPALPRDAFCQQSCETGYYRCHCRVCEKTLGRGPAHRQVCSRAKCQSQFRRHPEAFFGARYPYSQVTDLCEKSQPKSNTYTCTKSDRAWRQIAGPADLHPVNLVVDPTDPKIAASNAANAKFWRQARTAAECEALFQRDTPPLNLIGGHKFPDAPKLDWRPAEPPRDRSIEPSIGDGLEIPSFLRRADWPEDRS